MFDQVASAQYLNPEKSLTQYVHKYWDADAGLPQGSINAIAQTDDGYIWFGTQEGLVRFDGINFTVFDTKTVEVFKSNDIRILQLDSIGSLWIGTRNRGLVRYKDGEFAIIANQDSLEDKRITAFVESNKGHFWVGTAESGLKELNKGKISNVAAIEAKNITALHETEEGELWIGTRDAGLIRYASGEVKTFTTDDGLAGNAITALANCRHGGLWIGTKESGLAHYHGGAFFSTTIADGLPSDKILSLYEDQIGSLWIGTDQRGIARLMLDTAAMEAGVDTTAISTKPELLAAIHASFHKNMTISSFSSEEGLSYDVAKAFFQDIEGNLWIGTDGGGANMLREGKFTTYTTHQGLVDDYIYAVHEDLYGNMWFSTEKGVTRLSGNETTSFSESDGLASDFVVSLESTQDSSVWLGTYGGGLNRYRGGKFTRYTSETGLPGDAVFGLYHASNGDLWIGTEGGAAVYNGSEFIPYTENEGLSSNYVTVMMERSDRSVWIGTYNAGINRIVKGEISTFTTEDGLSNNAVLSLYEDDEGIVWVGTYGGGLNRIDGDTITVYTTREGLFNDNVVQILEDDDGYLWMSCNKGLFRVRKDELNAFAEGAVDNIHSIVYGLSDGLKSKEFNGGVQPAGWKGQDGKLWFPTSKGVAMINPSDILQNHFPPRMLLENVLVDGVETSIESGAEFSPGQNKIEFHYAGLSYISPKNVRYKYKLEGVDKDWVDAGARRAAYYTNLEPGHYTFRVKAENNDGLESRSASTYTFYLKPFFYQTVWFYIFAILTTVLSILVFYRWRVAQIKAHEQELEKLVDQRTRNLEERTADLLKALEENKEIIGITSHDLKNPLGGIIGLADILLEDLAELENDKVVDDGIENVQLVKVEAERMLRIVTDLLDRHRSEELHHHSKENINLVDLVADSIRRNQPAADHKEINIHYDNSSLLLVEIDEDSMLRVADNLISNAIKYSPQGTNVWISLTTGDNWVRFNVQDEGPGLTEEDKQKVFGKMQRLSAQPTAGEHSTGLGLFIVKQLMDEVGGEVGVESEFGNGACFWIQVPLLNSFVGV